MTHFYHVVYYIFFSGGFYLHSYMILLILIQTYACIFELLLLILTVLVIISTIYFFNLFLAIYDYFFIVFNALCMSCSIFCIISVSFGFGIYFRSQWFCVCCYFFMFSIFYCHGYWILFLILFSVLHWPEFLLIIYMYFMWCCMAAVSGVEYFAFVADITDFYVFV